MDSLDLCKSLTVDAFSDVVVISTKDAYNSKGEPVEFEVSIGMWADEATRFANAILHAVATAPKVDESDVPADLYLPDGTLNPAHSK